MVKDIKKMRKHCTFMPKINKRNSRSIERCSVNSKNKRFPSLSEDPQRKNELILKFEIPKCNFNPTINNISKNEST